MKDKKQLSTTALSKLLALPLKELFSILEAKGWIEKKRDHWSLTLAGIENGGQFIDHPVYGKYITWPAHTDIRSLGINDKSEFMTATDIGATLELTGRDINHIFSDLGWVQKEKKGWVTTDAGTRNYGIQRENIQSGNCYVIWHKSVKQKPGFKDKLKTFETFDIARKSQTENDIFTRKREQYRTADGHYVASSAEVIIDNWLYEHGIVHACGKKLPVDKEVFSSFYLPAEKIYIEYIGSGIDHQKQVAQDKINACNKLKLKLVELNDTDLEQLDNALAKKLLGFGLKPGQ